MLYCLVCGTELAAACPSCKADIKSNSGSIHDLYSKAISAESFDERVRLMRILVEKGYTEAERELGIYYKTGSIGGIKQDCEKAKELLSKAAAKGDKGALFCLGGFE